MALVNLGRVAIVNKGEWDSASDYKQLDLVTYGTSVYLGKASSIAAGTLPTDSTYWTKLGESSFYTGATPPTAPTNGLIWFDTTVKVPKVYSDGSWYQTTLTAQQAVDVANVSVLKAQAEASATEAALAESNANASATTAENFAGLAGASATTAGNLANAANESAISAEASANASAASASTAEYWAGQAALVGSTKVALTGDQTIDGVKTFTSSPIVPVPTADTQAANKAYVDSKTGAASETAAGIVELATVAEVQAGTDNTRAVTPAGMRAGLNASGSAPIYACRAWVNFNGTGTVAIRASGNVSSIKDNGTGNYTVNFVTAMPDANYSEIVGTGTQSTPSVSSALSFCTGSRSSTAITIVTSDNNVDNAYDPQVVNISIFR